MGNQLWQYLAFFLYVVTAVVPSKLVDLLVANWLQRWAAKTETKWDDRLLKLIRGPLKVIVFVIFGVVIMHTPDWLQVYMHRGFGVVVACFGLDCDSG